LDVAILVKVLVGWLVIFVALSKVCEKVEEAATHLATRLKLPASVAGATLLATSSSAPEFFTSTSAAVLHGVFEVGLITIVWSALFNILVIPGFVSLASPQSLKISKEVMHRDGVGYLGTVFIVLLVIWDEMLTRQDAVIMLILYAVYLHVIRLMAEAHKEETEEIEEGEELLSPGMIALYFAVGLALIGVGTHFMIELGFELGEAAAIDVLIFSAFIFAPGTSVPDLMMSYFSAKRGEGSAAISNVFGSNVFDLTICLAVPILIVGDTMIELGPVWPSIIMLVVVQCMVLLFVRTGWKIEKWEGVMMLVAFVVCCVIFLFTMPSESGAAEHSGAPGVEQVEAEGTGLAPD
jgi:cation:H+ antiporter|tara:strand:+ start:133 stop:1185 length:1053 start_codon:yes stop_codon:yes gene_type:complete